MNRKDVRNLGSDIRFISTKPGNLAPVGRFFVGSAAFWIVTLLLLIPGNALIHAISGNYSVNAILPVTGAVALIIISVILTLIGGIIPSKSAAKKDPVTALRTE